MTSDLHCPSCEAPVPVEKPEAGQEATCHNCKSQFWITAELIAASDRTVFRPAPRRKVERTTATKQAASVAQAPAQRQSSGTPRPSDTVRSFDTGRPFNVPRLPATHTPPPLAEPVNWKQRLSPISDGRLNVVASLVWCGVALVPVVLCVSIAIVIGVLLSAPGRKEQNVAGNSESPAISNSTEITDGTFQTLKSQLTDGKPDIRQTALDTLSKAKLTSAMRIELDRRLLQDCLISEKDPAVAAKVVAAIVEGGPPDAERLRGQKTNLPLLLPGLAVLVGHNEPAARKWAMQTLAEFEPRFSSTMGPGAPMGAYDSLLLIMRKLVENAAIRSAEERRLAARATRAIDVNGNFTGGAFKSALGANAESQMIVALANQKVEERHNAALALGFLGQGELLGGRFSPPSATAIDALVGTLKSDDRLLHELALQSLARLDPKGNHTVAAARKQFAGEAVAMLADLLHNLEPLKAAPAPSPGARGEAAHDPAILVRLHLVRSLGQFGPEAVAVETDLQPISAAGNAVLKQAAEYAIKQIRGEFPVDSVSGGLIAQGRDAAFIEQLKSPDPAIRDAGAKGLKALGAGGVNYLTLIRVVLGPDAEHREAVASVLVELDPIGTRAAQALGRGFSIPADSLLALFKSDPHTRRFTSRVLAELDNKPPATFSLLMALLRENNADLQRDAFYTLSRYNPSGERILAALQREYGTDTHLRLAASFADPDSQVKACLADMLTRMHPTNPKVVADLKLKLSDPNPQVRTLAGGLLAMLQPAEAKREEIKLYRQFMALANADLDRKNLTEARKSLAFCPPKLRNFEWHFANRLAQADSPSAPPSAGGPAGAAPTFPLDLAVVPFRASIGPVFDVKFGPEGAGLTSGAVVDLGNGNSLFDGGLAASGANGDVAVWDLGRQQVLDKFKADPAACNIDFDNTGTRLVSVGTQANMWSVPRAKNLGQWPEKKIRVHGALFHASGGEVALACGNHLRFWKVSGLGGAIVPDSQTQPALAEVVDMAFGVDGTSYLAALKNGHIVLWTTAATKPKSVRQLGERIDSFAYSKDGKYMAAAGQKIIKLWAIEGANLREVPVLPPLNQAPFRALSFNPAGDRLVAGDANGRIIVWDANDGGQVLLAQTFGAGPIAALAFHGGGQLLAAAAGENVVSVLNGLPQGSGDSPDSSPAASGMLGGVPGGRSEPGIPGGEGTVPGGGDSDFSRPPGSTPPDRPRPGRTRPGRPRPSVPLPEEYEEPDEKEIERTTERVERTMATFDKDGDGAISKTEARGTLGSSFARIDIDMSGYLEFEELFQFLRPKTRKKVPGSEFSP